MNHAQIEDAAYKAVLEYCKALGQECSYKDGQRMARVIARLVANELAPHMRAGRPEGEGSD